MTEAAEMSETAETRGPVTRRRRTTITSTKQTKRQDAREKPSPCSSKEKAADKVQKHANNNGNVEKEMGKSTQQQQLANSPKKQRSAVEDINDMLR